MIYQHTQRSPLWLIVAVPFGIIVAVVLITAEADPVVDSVAVLGLVLLIAIMAHFSWLRITVDPGRARAAFGAGWPAKTVDLSTVTAVRVVRNRWWYGFGIRVVPNGWLWNVWGLDAVEFVLETGRVVRFGTDEPDQLLAAVSGFVAC
jgi:hypothetical protein